ncbi:arylformamidase [Oceanobacillus sp. FSL H7-0719]|uniref:arylformamidase n=1 Tax=Oceanobacillus sp. FSL H7-0719 TaxID=2954507 RepID=UPI00324F654F
MTSWIDISQTLTNELANWPGDKAFNYSLPFTKKETGSVNIGEIAMSVHNGTHLDAPFHYDTAGKTIDELPLDLTVGKAIVIDVSDTETINAEVLAKHNLAGAARVLLQTALPNNPNVFPETMPFIDPDAAAYLASQHVKLLGVDMPSVDAVSSKDLATHHALYQNGIYILENLMLDHVKAGLYEMIALPLKIAGADASPVRAIIRPIAEEDL